MKTWPLALVLALAALDRPAVAAAPATPPAQGAAPTGEDLAEAAGASLIGKPGPALKLKTVDGRRIDLASFYGKRPVYLKFWATWCAPCRLQMPHFENVERTRGGDIEVIAVNTGFNDTSDAVLKYRGELGLTMPVVIDDGRLADALHLRVTPQHIVIGRDGRILHVGQRADARLDHALDQAVAEAPLPVAGSKRIAEAHHPGPPPVLTTLAGEPLALRQASRPTVIFFFSPWCESYFKTSRPVMSKACGEAREQVRALAGASRAHWVGVAAGLWATRNDLADDQQKHALPMPVALDETGAFFRAFRISDVPSFVVLDQAGRVAARTRSAEDASRAAARLQPSNPRA
jgi:thiol-disulfide isomerase/thioredoxin